MGTISGVGLWMSLLLKSSFALIGFGAYLDVLTDLPLRPLALLLLALIVVLNVLGVKKVGKVQVVMVVTAVSGLVALALLGLTRFESHFMRPLFQLRHHRIFGHGRIRLRFLRRGSPRWRRSLRKCAIQGATCRGAFSSPSAV